MRNHEQCKHKEAKYCEKYDVFYCESCKKEWRVSYSSVTVGSPDNMTDGGTITSHLLNYRAYN